MNKDFESIREKLRKLQALAERGEVGEARNARAAIERICAEYGVSIEELATEEKQRYSFKVPKSGPLHDIFLQCYCITLDVDAMEFWKGEGTIIVKLTRLQYVELSNLWNWHKDNFSKELEETKDALLLAYLRKHHLYGDNKGDEVRTRELTEKEKTALLRSVLMSDSLSNRTYQKQLEDKS